MTAEPNAEQLKDQGNTAVKDGKFEDAVLYYSHAIKLDPSNHILYSNRSHAFFKMQQYYLAITDANEAIKLSPNWAKGYFRKGEVEFATYHFFDAFLSYEKALNLQPEDQIIKEAMMKANDENIKDMKADDQIPWLGAGIGIILGVIIVLADFFYTSKPTHPILMAITTITIAVFGYGIARIFRYYVKCQREAMLEPPTNLLENEETSQNTGKATFTRYTKSQARQRYKKGKL